MGRPAYIDFNYHVLPMKPRPTGGGRGAYSFRGFHLKVLREFIHGNRPLPLNISTDCLHSLEKLHLCIDTPCKFKASIMFDVLQHLHGVKFLTLNLELVEFLSSSIGNLISTPPSPFANLKSLKIYPTVDKMLVTTQPDQPPKLSTEISNYFLDGSPSVSFTMISQKVFTRITLYS
ncbi:hypothetical protein M8C21_002384 [Ambrosia artemisiifolia]|uniref:Uncharacterized protein n=1 Tax=Ambrosia artemisiifolia TaxID=4212 RepID=A0AAD5C980_AMBAR|nr:hypothetical protein M8C21_002384 [Ambrosia artemisiifolia]